MLMLGIAGLFSEVALAQTTCTPAPNGDITVDRTSFFSGMASGTYVMTVSAVGASGQSQSTPVTVTW